jgi:LuxR family maltose regulon positive regulatory protein
MHDLIATKIRIPPPRAALVPRDRLSALLQRGLELPLTLVVAPAGFGKTTLVTDLLGRLPPEQLAWLSCERADNEPLRFWRYLLAACERARPGLSTAALAILQAPQPVLKAVVAALINALSDASTPLVLVLDDYHLIEHEAIHTTFSDLIDHQPPMLRLLLTSRSVPPLPLPRLRARGQLLEIDTEMLRFQDSEAARFLTDTMGLSLTPELLAALTERTEGWAAGLQLAALSLQGRADQSSAIAAFRGSNRMVLDYLLDEVLARLPTETQRFLHSTAILTRLSGPLCDFVLGGAGQGGAMLHNLERNNLFVVRLDDEGQWYRYHHLFAEAMQQRLLHTDASQLPILHARAAQWWLAREAWADAYQHALASGDTAIQSEVLEAASGPLLMSGQSWLLMGWFDQLRLPVAQRQPLLNLFYAWSLLLSGQLALVEPTLHLIEAAIEAHEGNERVGWRGQVAAIRSYRQVMLGDIDGAMEAAQPAIATLAQNEPLLRAVIAMNLGAVYALAGQLNEAIQLLSEAQAAAKAIGNPWVVLAAQEFLGQLWLEQVDMERAQAAFAHIVQAAESAPNQRLSATIGLAAIATERNKLTAATAYARQAQALAQQVGLPEWQALSELQLSRLALAHADSAAARALRAEALQYEQRCISPARPLVAAIRARIDAMLGEAPIPAADQTPSLDPAGFRLIQHKATYLAAAHTLLASAHYAQAAALLRAIAPIAEADGRTASLIEISAMLALAEHALGHADAAFIALHRAIELAAAHGYVRSFVELGPPMQHLLAQHQSALPYAAILLAAFPPSAAAPAASTPAPSIDALNPRELEVLRLVAQGHSNTQIAEQLILAVGTVKKHLNNIFAKLDASSRTQAVARARAAGLLEE